MLKEFWEAKKHLIQMSGILCGVGALFLSIPVPEDPEAHNALLHLQFIWLIIITISAIALLFQLLLLLTVIERKTKGSNLNLDETLSVIMSGVIVYFIWNIWEYAYALYGDSFFDFLNSGFGYGAVLFFVALGYSYWRWIVIKHVNLPATYRIVISLGALAPPSLLLGAWLSFVGHRGPFEIEEWFTTTLIVYCIALFTMILVDLYGKNKKRHLNRTSGSEVSNVKNDEKVAGTISNI